MLENDLIADDNTEASEEQLRYRKRELAELAEMMKTPAFRKFASRLLDQCGVGREVFAVDPHIHAHNAGRRSVGNWVEYELKAASTNNYFKILTNE